MHACHTSGRYCIYNQLKQTDTCCNTLKQTSHNSQGIEVHLRRYYLPAPTAHEKTFECECRFTEDVTDYEMKPAHTQITFKGDTHVHQ